MVKLAMTGQQARSPPPFFSGRRRRSTDATGAPAAEYHSLHFETCYHQGIEFCIERGMQRFEPGTQGEHKVSRGLRADAHLVGALHR